MTEARFSSSTTARLRNQQSTTEMTGRSSLSIAGDTKGVTLKTLDFSPLSEFSVGKSLRYRVELATGILIRDVKKENSG
jgi:hypothetical protein